MQSAKNKREFRPRTVAVKNLYEENVRLQKLCAAHRKQIRGMQRNVEYLKLRYTVLAQATGLTPTEIAQKYQDAFNVPTETAEDAAARAAFMDDVPHEQFTDGEGI